MNKENIFKFFLISPTRCLTLFLRILIIWKKFEGELDKDLALLLSISIQNGNSRITKF